MNTYWLNIKYAVSSLYTGLKLSFRHILEANESRKPIGMADTTYFQQQTGIVTLQYPHQSIAVPDNGRYRLHNEIDDCIVCDKCAKICPVNCIEIEPIRAVEEIGKTSDGTSKRIYAAKFDIDMGKCCFCGLCTTVCPTECLTMTKAYDFSEYDVADHNYAFAEMTPLEILEKKQKLEVFAREKEAKAAALKANAPKEDTPGAGIPKPSFKPKLNVRPVAKPLNIEEKPADDAKAMALEIMRKKNDAANRSAQAKPVFRPLIKSTETPPSIDQEEKKEEKDPVPAPSKPIFRPRPMMKKPKDEGEAEK